MNIVLILMIRNESRIIERCLKAVADVVDAFCIHDTGSSDNTCALVDEFLVGRTGCLTRSEWKDFGHNRTLSFQNAQTYVRDTLKWDLAKTYGLLLDADMVFNAGSLRRQELTEKGYTVVQMNGTLEYPNCRLVRLDYDWVCRGVTHEYWDGPTKPLPKDVCSIDDRNDGGCKSDKFERDARLLEEGLQKEPDNVRYMFYLAQTYHCLGRDKDAIQMYKKRFKAGGWDEERWYSLYMIGQSYNKLNQIAKFEKYMNLAYEFRPSRAEPLYKLTKYFREIAHHYKSYHYANLGDRIGMSNDSLFVESDIYNGLFQYEKSILDYYVKSDRKEGARSSVRYLLHSASMVHNVLANLHFYTAPISTNVHALATPQPFGPEFRSSAISIVQYPYANVRYVNYWIEKGEYKTPRNEPVQTHNAYINLETMEVLQEMDESSIGLPKRDHHIRGLEDVRVCGNEFTATVHDYDPNVRVMRGNYNKELGTYSECVVYPSPLGKPCEKNWLLMEGTSNMIYDWYPLRILDKSGKEVVQHATPPLFSILRGSASGVIHKNELWVLTHFVEYSTPRKYYHCLVKLNKDTYKPTAVSLPFVFRSPSIEYCTSFTVNPIGQLRFYVSFNDSDSSVMICPDSAVEFFSI
jgi:tetratricopeptide (TPR) repeat protein